MEPLFRVWTEDSHGTNSKGFFASATSSSCSANRCRGHRSRNATPEQLEAALLNKKACFQDRGAENPFIFTTPSLLFALLLALQKHRKGKEVYVTYIDRASARTPEGNAVAFKAASDLFKESRYRVTNKDGSVRLYTEVVTTTDCINLGGGSRTATLSDLIKRGIMKMYPAMQKAQDANRDKPWRLNIPWEWLQDFWFQESKPLTPTTLNLAATIAAGFVCNNVGQASVALAPFASVLGLRRRQEDDPMLFQWLNQNSALVIDDESQDEDDVVAVTELAEVKQSQSILIDLQAREIIPSTFAVSSTELQTQIGREQSEWESWFRTHRRRQRSFNQTQMEASDEDDFEYTGQRHGLQWQDEPLDQRKANRCSSSLVPGGEAREVGRKRWPEDRVYRKRYREGGRRHHGERAPRQDGIRKSGHWKRGDYRSFRRGYSKV